MICRLCLQTVNNRNSQDVFAAETGFELIGLILKYFNLKIAEDDKVSTKVCRKCSRNLKEFHKFWSDIDEKQKNLKAYKCKAENDKHEPESEFNSLVYNFTTEFLKMEDPMPLHEAPVASDQEENGYDLLETINTNDEVALDLYSEIEKDNDHDRRDIKIDINKTQSQGLVDEKSKNVDPDTTNTDASCKARTRNGKHVRQPTRKANSDDDTDSDAGGSAWSMGSKGNTDITDFSSDDDKPLKKKKKVVNKKPQQVKANNSGGIVSLDPAQGEFSELNCGVCRSAFCSFEELVDHSKLKHKYIKRPFVKCCSKQFFSTEQIDKHKLTHNVQCEICKKIFNRKSSLNQHMREVHGGAGANGMHECQTCKESFRSAKRLKNHVRLHSKKEKTYSVCEVCSKMYTTPTALRRHYQSAHEQIKPFKCSKCNKKFYFESSFKEHEIQCELRAAADKCRAESKPTADDDAATNKDVDSAQCKTCFKNFANVHQLRRHIESIHERIYRHVCDQCGKKFKTKKVFERHLLEHSGVTQPSAQCDICGDWLKNRESLRRHMYRHENADCRCRICGRQCPTRYALKSHVDRIHREDRNFKCTYCDSTFKLRMSWKEHMAIHTDTQLYTCPHCPKESRSHSNMYVHIKRMHQVEWLNAKMERLQKRLANAEPSKQAPVVAEQSDLKDS